MTIQIEVIDEEEKVKLYIDDKVRKLSEMFHPITYTTGIRIKYGNPAVEQKLWPLVAVGKTFGRYFGLDLDGLNTLLGGKSFAKEDEALPNVRIENFNGKKIYFPIAALLDEFYVQRINLHESFVNGLMSAKPLCLFQAEQPKNLN